MKKEAVIKSARLDLRPMTADDFDAAAAMLRDAEVMYAWEYAFTDDEIAEWINKRLRGYKSKGYDYFLAVDRETRAAVGQIGLLSETVNNAEEIGLGYILRKEYWGKGYAREGAEACLGYAFDTLGAERVIATIRPENTRSAAVARFLGMTVADTVVKHARGKPMPHDVYAISRADYLNRRK